MSYLHTPRLVFTGDFLSDVSTVNNDPAHYNNSTFQPSFQLPGKGSTNGWWNPEGGAVFNLQECSIKKAVYLDGSEVEGNDELIGQFVKCAEGRASGKMVDLDPQMQMCSELWGIKLRIMNQAEELLLSGTLTATGFRDLQIRQTAGASVNGQPLGGSWAATLTDVEWGDAVSSNRFMSELKSTTQQNKLSVNLNGFGYYYNHAANGRFSLGRMLGSIGPWFENEPEIIAPTRKLYGVAVVNGTVYFDSTNFIVEQNKIVLDLGQSFPIANSLGRIDYNQPIFAAVSKVSIKKDKEKKKAIKNGTSYSKIMNPDDFDMIGKINYETGDNWLLNTGGLVSLDVSDELANKLTKNQLILLTVNSSGEYVLLTREAIDGYVVKADNFVQRVDADQEKTVRFYAWQWGKPLVDKEINVTLQKPTATEPISSSNPIFHVPGNNYPEDGLSFDATIVTDENGFAQMCLQGNRIDQPRVYLPGQMYFLSYLLDQIEYDSQSGLIPDQINVHLRSYFPIPETPTWDDISYEMTQFSNLYPIMSKYFIDLSDPQALIANEGILTFAFTREITDPLYMPVTRDLSDSKRLTILKWLKNPIIKSDKKENALEEQHKKLNLMSGPNGHKATKMQLKLKKLTDAKNGSMSNFPELKSLNY